MQPPTRAGSAPAKTSKIKAKLPIVLVVLGIALTPIWITALGWFPLRLFGQRSNPCVCLRWVSFPCLRNFFGSSVFKLKNLSSSGRDPMHKMPAQIARSLRAFRNAQRLGLLHGVHIAPGLRVRRYKHKSISNIRALPCRRQLNGSHTVYDWHRHSLIKSGVLFRTNRKTASRRSFLIGLMFLNQTAIAFFRFLRRTSNPDHTEAGGKERECAGNWRATSSDRQIREHKCIIVVVKVAILWWTT